MAVLSFLFPIVGWILWAVKKDSNPEDAHKCAKWAWIGVVVYFVCVFFLGLAGARY